MGGPDSGGGEASDRETEGRNGEEMGGGVREGQVGLEVLSFRRTAMGTKTFIGSFQGTSRDLRRGCPGSSVYRLASLFGTGGRHFDLLSLMETAEIETE